MHPATVEVLATAEEAAGRVVGLLSGAVEAAVAERGRACVALSGGRTPAPMARLLAERDLPWEALHLFQVDERAVPEDSRDRNWSILVPLAARLPPGHAHPMPVGWVDADVAYAEELRRWAGDPAVLDAVQLGLGADGHTASLVPGDPARTVVDRDVAWTGPYQGHVRLTLARPALQRARTVVWLVTGEDKAAAVASFLAGAPESVAASVVTRSSVVVLDAAAASGIDG